MLNFLQALDWELNPEFLPFLYLSKRVFDTMQSFGTMTLLRKGAGEGGGEGVWDSLSHKICIGAS